MYGNVVLSIPHHDFEHELTRLKADAGVKEDTDLTTDQLKILVTKYKQVYQKNGLKFPSDPYEQLYNAIYAVFNSWQSERAIKYREAESITGLLGKLQ
jgi:pyruvate,orthophosphate dikinase